MCQRATLLLSLCARALTTTPVRHRYVGYEEAHVPLFASPEFQGISRRGAYGDTVTQMDASIGG